MRLGAPCRLLLALALLAVAPPAAALEPEQRVVTVISARVWEGHEYREVFVPSTVDEMVLMAGGDSAIAFVRTLEYYWPLSRRVYVDFQRQRDLVEGELIVRRDGREIAREKLQPMAIHYPQGAVRGNAELVWGEAAEEAYANHQEAEREFAREFAAARRAHTAYERRLVEAGAARRAGETPAVVEPPPPLPEPSLRLVTQPRPHHRVALEPGRYTIALEEGGRLLPGTERRLRVVAPAGTGGVVADIVPSERWTRPLPSNAAGARIYARPGAVFYMTLSEASRHGEEDYLPVVNPQAEPVAGRDVWVRRGPSGIEELLLAWDGGAAAALARDVLKVEQTRGTSFGYRVRAAREGEAPDLRAFTIAVPGGETASRGMVSGGEVSGDGRTVQLVREIVVVPPRNAGLALGLALAPLALYFAFMASARLRRQHAGRSLQSRPALHLPHLGTHARGQEHRCYRR